MKLFDVYNTYGIEPIWARGCTLYDSDGKQYLDFYGGHAVISIGHSHPHYVEKLYKQLDRIGFYSNAVHNGLQKEFAKKFGELSGCNDYQLFLCNSGAEANENALKLASFQTGKKKVLTFHASFHGRTSGALAVTDIPSYSAPFNQTDNVCFVSLNDIKACKSELEKGKYAAVIIEGIQGVGGIRETNKNFMQELRRLCTEHGVILILDEIQSGCGRTGTYFAYQSSGIHPDIITTAKGIGNGFPMAAVLIDEKIKPVKNRLGTTFGGNHLACAAGIAVAEVMEQEELIKNAKQVGDFLKDELETLPGVQEVRGRGLMLGVEMQYPTAELRDKLLFEHRIFTGSSGKHTIRLLPPLCISMKETELFLDAFKHCLANHS